MRRLAIVLACFPAACGERAAEPPVEAQDDRGRIACMPPGESEFREVCSIDRTVDDRGNLLTLRLPDGGFHRLRVDANGGTVVAADGMQPATVSTVRGAIEVTIGGARFQLPAGGS